MYGPFRYGKNKEKKNRMDQDDECGGESQSNGICRYIKFNNLLNPPQRTRCIN